MRAMQTCKNLWSAEVLESGIGPVQRIDFAAVNADAQGASVGCRSATFVMSFDHRGQRRGLERNDDIKCLPCNILRPYGFAGRLLQLPTTTRNGRCLETRIILQRVLNVETKCTSINMFEKVCVLSNQKTTNNWCTTTRFLLMSKKCHHLYRSNRLPFHLHGIKGRTRRLCFIAQITRSSSLNA